MDEVSSHLGNASHPLLGGRCRSPPPEQPPRSALDRKGSLRTKKRRKSKSRTNSRSPAQETSNGFDPVHGLIGLRTCRSVPSPGLHSSLWRRRRRRHTSPSPPRTSRSVRCRPEARAPATNALIAALLRKDREHLLAGCERFRRCALRVRRRCPARLLSRRLLVRRGLEAGSCGSQRFDDLSKTAGLDGRRNGLQ
jgi:hypothetical protein